MSVQHFKSLLFKSHKIQVEIEREQRRPRPDWLRLLRLKKVRLVIKDRLYRLAQKGRFSASGFAGEYMTMRPSMAHQRVKERRE